MSVSRSNPQRARQRRCSSSAVIYVLATAAWTLSHPQHAVLGFTSAGWHNPRSSLRGERSPAWAPAVVTTTRPSTTSLNMFMGSDGGILGIGGPELFTILLVGYFVLGPSDLYKVVKEIGKFIQNFRTFSSDVAKTFETNMEDQLQLNEIRKAQQELTDAFSFRRTINVDQDSEAFATNVDSPRGETPVAAAVAASGKKIIRRRRVVKTSEDDTRVPDLEMPSAVGELEATAAVTATSGSEPELTPEELAIIDQEFEQYTSALPSPPSSTTSPTDGSGSSSLFSSSGFQKSESEAAATARFQQQLSGDWNNQVLANESELEPLAAVMQKIALLQEEKAAAESRLQEEFERRERLEQEYYEKQKALLEEAALQIQTKAYAGAVSGSSVGSGGVEASRGPKE